jgi:hypothetical protein
MTINIVGIEIISLELKSYCCIYVKLVKHFHYKKRVQIKEQLRRLRCHKWLPSQNSPVEFRIHKEVKELCKKLLKFPSGLGLIYLYITTRTYLCSELLKIIFWSTSN